MRQAWMHKAWLPFGRSLCPYETLYLSHIGPPAALDRARDAHMKISAHVRKKQRGNRTMRRCAAVKADLANCSTPQPPFSPLSWTTKWANQSSIAHPRSSIEGMSSCTQKFWTKTAQWKVCCVGASHCADATNHWTTKSKCHMNHSHLTTHWQPGGMLDT